MSIVSNLSKPNYAREPFSNYSPPQVAAALRTIITYTITDVFDLTPEETLWSSYHINEMLKPFEEMVPKSVPIAVTQELSSKEYSVRLSQRNEGSFNDISNNVENASLEDWVSIFMDMITQSYYPLRPMIEATIRGRISGLLSELGIGAHNNPRGALYLPNAVRYMLNAKKRAE